MKVRKTIAEINKKIKEGKAVVVTAEEMVDIVKSEGRIGAAKKVDVVTTGTFGPMCSSGAFINFGHTSPRIRASRVWINDVPCYAGIAAVDFYIGATEPRRDDPLNSNHPGEFLYGGGHVIQELVAGKDLKLVAESYVTDCYPRKRVEKIINIRNIKDAILLNPRNSYQNYNVAINLSKKTIYTYMGVLKPNGGNISYSSAGQLSPLLNDPYLLTIGVGTRIFLGGGIGYVAFHGTQHNPDVDRNEKGIPKEGAATLMVVGDMKNMSPKWLVGVSILGYGVSLMVGIGIPIPILNEEMAGFTGVSDKDIDAPIVDYGLSYPEGKGEIIGYTNYAELKSGEVRLFGRKIPTFSMSSYYGAKKIAEILKNWIKDGRFFLTTPQAMLHNMPKSKLPFDPEDYFC